MFAAVLLVIIGVMAGCNRDITPEDSEMIQSKIENYENYYLYYNEMIVALQTRNTESFTNNCVELYYYIGDSSDELTRKEYEGWTKEEIEEDLNTIVKQLCDNFGNEKLVEECLEEGKLIEYESDIINDAYEYAQYKPTKEEIDWGQALFMEYIMEVIGD